ncbi:MAG: zinc ribbon domain-containing protein [bacterium]
MPLYEYLCQDCGKTSELLVSASSDPPRCKSCESPNLKKLLSAHSTVSSSRERLPGPGDTACCGHSPGQAAGCAGPGSCCGKAGC